MTAMTTMTALPRPADRARTLPGGAAGAVMAASRMGGTC